MFGLNVEQIAQNNAVFGSLILLMGVGLFFFSGQQCCGGLIIGAVAYWGLSALLKRI